MPAPLFTIDQPHLLLVEGEDERRFFRALLDRRGRTDVQVHPYQGKNRLTPALPAIVRAPRFDQVRWLGITQDADDDPVATFRRVGDALTRVALPVPTRPCEAAIGEPAVVAFVLPDGTSDGDLEVLVGEAVAQEPTAPCVDAYIACLADAALLPRQASKAWIHAYLASLSRPDRRLGEAAEAGTLPLGNPLFDRFLGLLPTAPRR